MKSIDKILKLVEEKYSQELEDYLIHCEVLGLTVGYGQFVAFMAPHITAEERKVLLPRGLTRMADQMNGHRAMDGAFQQTIKKITTTGEKNVL
jgi:hypothetical protein